MGEVMKEASFSLAEAKFTSGDFNQDVLQKVDKAKIKVRSKKENVAGLTITLAITVIYPNNLTSKKGKLGSNHSNAFQKQIGKLD